MQSEHGEPPFVAALKDNHHHVAMPYAQRGKVGSRLVALALEVGKRKNLFFALIVGPYKRHLVRLLFGPYVHHVVSKVKVLGNVEMQMLSEVLL